MTENFEEPSAHDEPTPGLTDDQRRTNLLKTVAALGGTVTPRRDPMAKHGHAFAGLEQGIEADLAFLARGDYLDERFFDRVTICTRCDSHHLNIREVCPACGSTHYTEEPLLHHFRCGFVGRITEFDPGDGTGRRICPKCTTQLKYLGTDYDRLGKTYLCIDCGTSFQDAPVRSVCLSCETEVDADDLATAEVFGYAITSLGTAAIRRGSLFEGDSEVLYIAGAAVYRPAIMFELLEYEAKRIQRFKGTFSLMMVEARGPEGVPVPEDAEGNMITRLRERLRGTDIVGKVAEHVFIACMPQTPIAGAEIVRARFAEEQSDRRLLLETKVVEIAGPDDLATLLTRIKTATRSKSVGKRETSSDS